MKSIILILLLTFTLTGCYPNNDKIIAETKKCNDAGLATARNGFNQVTCSGRLNENNKFEKSIQSCINNEGTPVLSYWDNRLKRCDYPPSN